jgi:branched-subunit amino acid transport protein
MRAAFVVGAAARRPSARMARVLPQVGPAVIAAITAPALVAPHGVISVAGTPPALLAGALSWAIWRRTSSLPVALFAGLGAWWLAGWLVTAF